jgi:AraC-like DNA-binding protein
MAFTISFSGQIIYANSMKKGQDILVDFPGLKIIHQKIPGKELGNHSHLEHEFFLPITGAMTIHFEGVDFVAGPGKMLYVPPKIEHAFSSSTMGSGERVIWLISDVLWKKHISQNFSITVLPLNSLAKELLFYLLLKRSINGERYFISALIESLGDSLISSKLKSTHMELIHLLGKIEDKRILKSIMILNANLGIDSLSRVATASGMGLRNFNRLFLKETNLTPKEYLQMKRMEKARALLATTGLTITDISLEVGYNSVSKFIDTFKKLEGKLPSDFRNQIFFPSL